MVVTGSANFYSLGHCLCMGLWDTGKHFFSSLKSFCPQISPAFEGAIKDNDYLYCTTLVPCVGDLLCVLVEGNGICLLPLSLSISVCECVCAPMLDKEKEKEKERERMSEY